MLEHGKIGAAGAIAGAVLMFAGTSLHPMSANPNDAVAAFTEYAAARGWVAVHLAQFVGFAWIACALLFLSEQLTAAGVRKWPRLGAAAVTASLALCAALQAIDGIALKAMVDNWAAASATQKDAAFQAAFAVRQIEIGLAAMLALMFGVTAIVYGVAIWGDHTYPKWVGGLALTGGVPMSIAGVVIAHTGFSELAMTINMPAGLVLTAWMIAVGIFMWRQKELSAAQ
jgi:hypothetical protein